MSEEMYALNPSGGNTNSAQPQPAALRDVGPVREVVVPARRVDERDAAAAGDRFQGRPDHHHLGDLYSESGQT